MSYAIERYQKETYRLYTVLNKQLRETPWLAGENYSIADMATYPWVVSHERQNIALSEFQAIKDWFERIRDRSATQRAYKLAEQ